MTLFFTIILAYLPFQLALNPAADVDLASIRVLGIGVFLSWVWVSLKKKKIVVGNPWFFTAVISFVTLASLSLAVAQNTAWAGRKLLFVFSIVVFYFTAVAVLDTDEKRKKALKVLVSGAAILGLVGVIQFFAQFVFGLDEVYGFWGKNIAPVFLGKAFSQAVLENPSWLVGISGKTYLRATSFFPDPHMFSFYLGLLAPVALGLAVEEKKQARFWFLAFGILIFADMLTFSRGGYFGLLSGAIAAMVLFWGKMGPRTRGMALAGGTIFLLIFLASPFFERARSTFDPQEGSNKGRIEMWEKAASVILEKPLLGSGLGNYPIEVDPTAGYRDPIYAHNTFLDIASETGLANGCIFFAILVGAASKFLRERKKSALRAMMAVGLIIFGAHSFFDTALFSPVVMPLFWTIISFANHEKNEKKNER